jgi:hypothetical protein
MIKICFPPGCYGHYLAQCIYHFTDIANSQVTDFVLDADGSSHTFRHNYLARNFVQIGHFSYETSGHFHPETLDIDPNDKFVTILPVEQHWLDYYNNQFVKQLKSNLISYVAEQISLDEIENKLQNHWNYGGGIDSDIPRWIMRELLSYYIHDVLRAGYAHDRCALKDSVKVTTNMFFEDFVKEFKNLCSHLDVKILANDLEMQDNNHRFQSVQRYNNSQKRCMDWVNDVLANRDSASPVQTLFDEAYIQHTLRSLDFEIRCDGLDQFPDTSAAMRSLIYQP